MDPSQENRQETSPGTPKTTFLPAILVVLLLLVIVGLGYFFYSDSIPVGLYSNDTQSSRPVTQTRSQISASQEHTPQETPEEVVTPDQPSPLQAPPSQAESEEALTVQKESPPKNQTETVTSPSPESMAGPELSSDVAALSSTPEEPAESLCKAPERRLHNFYSNLDKQPYMSQYQLSSSSEQHFTALIQKLLNNPPQVTRESDDLYTILKNTAHFFRVSGKDNVLMMKGILGNEKEHIEQILADYNLLISTPECATSPQVASMDQDALYEYACFFLNTMGGRLYLFRRDSLSRMVVTYYAILLIDRANQENNNNHGLDLKSFVDMLIAEMESGGSSLKYQDRYLDSLYLMKEKYQ